MRQAYFSSLPWTSQCSRGVGRVSEAEEAKEGERRYSIERWIPVWHISARFRPLVVSASTPNQLALLVSYDPSLR